MDEFSAAVYHQLPSIIRDADVGERFFDHLVDGSPGDGEVVVVARGRGHPGRRGRGALLPRSGAPLSSPAGLQGAGSRRGAGGAAGSGAAGRRRRRCRRWASGSVRGLPVRGGRETLLGFRAPSAAAPATAASTTSFGRWRRCFMSSLRRAKRRTARTQRGSAPSSSGGGAAWLGTEGGREAEAAWLPPRPAGDVGSGGSRDTFPLPGEPWEGCRWRPRPRFLRRAAAAQRPAPSGASAGGRGPTAPGRSFERRVLGPAIGY